MPTRRSQGRQRESSSGLRRLFMQHLGRGYSSVAAVKLLRASPPTTTDHNLTILSRRCSKEAEDCCSRTRHQRS